MPRRHSLGLSALFLIGFSSAALAQEGRYGDLSLNAVVGGALPYSTGEGGYLVTRLINPDQDSRTIDFSRTSPFGPGVKNVFDARPQVGLGGRFELGETSGGAKLALRAMFSTAMERPAEGERPLMGLAGLSVLF
jgi:hypothetical protein